MLLEDLRSGQKENELKFLSSACRLFYDSPAVPGTAHYLALLSLSHFLANLLGAFRTDVVGCRCFDINSHGRLNSRMARAEAERGSESPPKSRSEPG